MDIWYSTFHTVVLAKNRERWLTSTRNVRKGDERFGKTDNDITEDGRGGQGYWSTLKDGERRYNGGEDSLRKINISIREVQQSGPFIYLRTYNTPYSKLLRLLFFLRPFLRQILHGQFTIPRSLFKPRD